jgi:hypothetical protein
MQTTAYPNLLGTKGYVVVVVLCKQQQQQQQLCKQT